MTESTLFLTTFTAQSAELLLPEIDLLHAALVQADETGTALYESVDAFLLANRNQEPDLAQFKQRLDRVLKEQTPQELLEKIRAQGERVGASLCRLPFSAQKKPQTGNEAALQRAALREQEVLRFRYGELAPNHPAQIYIDNLASRIPIKNNFTPHFFILPDWKEINAVSLPDGTIFISWELLKSAETEEALLGVMAHEYVHAYRQHVNKVLNVENKNFIKRVLTQIGLKRLHEYEADLRGAIEILDAMELSPIPFKEFLEGLHQRGHDIVHGSSLDRALNIATMAHLVDLRGIEEKNYKPIPAEILQDPHQTGTTKTFRIIVEHPRFRVARGELEAEKRRGQRREQIETLNLDQLSHAIHILSEQIESNKGTTDEDPDDETVLTKACERFTEMANIPDGIPRLATFLFFTESKLLWERNAPKRIGSPAELESLRHCFEKLAIASPLKQSYTNTNEVWDFILSLAIKQKLFEDKKSHRFDIQAFERFIKDWSETLAKLSSRFDTVSTRTSDDYIEQAAYYHATNLVKLYPNQEINIYRLFSITYHRQKVALDKIAAELALPNLKQIDRMIPKISTRIMALIENPTLKTLGEAIQIVNLGLEDVSMSDKVHKFAPEYATVSILSYCLQNFKAFDSLSLFEKELAIFAAAKWLNLRTLKEYLEEEEYEKNVDNEEDRSRAILRKKIEKLTDPSFLYDKSGTDNTVQIYRYCVDLDYYRDHVGLLPSTPQRDESALTTYAANFLATHPLSEWIPLLDQWKREGADVEKVLADNPRLLGVLQIKLAEALENGELDTIDFSSLLRMSAWIANPTLQALFQRTIKEKIWASLSFEEKLDVVFPPSEKKGIRDGATQEALIEEEMKTENQFHAAKERLKTNLDSLLEEGRAETGLAVLGDINMVHRDAIGFLKNLLTSSLSDGPLKEMVYEMMKGIQGAMYEKDFIKAINNASEAIRHLFMMGRLGKQILLRKLLVGEGGALTSPDKKEAFLNMLFREWVTSEPDQQDIAGVIQDVKKALVANKEWQLLYFAFQSVLSDQIAIPPGKKETVPWANLYVVEQDLGDPKAVREILWPKVPQAAQKKPWNYSRQFLHFGEERLYQALEAKGLVQSVEKKQMTPLRFVKEVASKMGAMGVRFLQLLPLIAELKPEYQEEFSSVYDRVRGQSKLAALTLLEREWPQVWDAISEVGKSVGGGSVVTVYEARNKKGEEEIIKVRNPNILYHLDEVTRFAKEVLGYLAAHLPAGRQATGDRQTYAAARLLLDDIYAWVKADINFEGFLEQDREFKSWTENLNLTSGRYRIYVPKSKGPASPYFSREEKVSGKNLTDWEGLIKEGHDMRVVTSLLVKYYVAQIANGRVLSDIHIGNNAVTPDGKIAVYDRNFYLNLSDKEKELAGHFLNPSADSSIIEQAFYDYLVIDGADTMKIKKEITTVVQGLKAQDWLAAQKGLMRLRQLGVKMPLPFTLILKNFQSLSRMAQKAGFKNLFETFSYNK